MTGPLQAYQNDVCPMWKQFKLEFLKVFYLSLSFHPSGTPRDKLGHCHDV